MFNWSWNSHAKERGNEKQKIASESLKDTFKEGNQITPGLVFKSNTCWLGKPLLDIQEERMQKKEKRCICCGK